jgi:hypothetical protein
MNIDKLIEIIQKNKIKNYEWNTIKRMKNELVKDIDFIQENYKNKNDLKKMHEAYCFYVAATKYLELKEKVKEIN